MSSPTIKTCDGYHKEHPNAVYIESSQINPGESDKCMTCSKPFQFPSNAPSAVKQPYCCFCYEPLEARLMAWPPEGRKCYQCMLGLNSPDCVCGQGMLCAEHPGVDNSPRGRW